MRWRITLRLALPLAPSERSVAPLPNPLTRCACAAARPSRMLGAMRIPRPASAGLCLLLFFCALAVASAQTVETITSARAGAGGAGGVVERGRGSGEHGAAVAAGRVQSRPRCARKRGAGAPTRSLSADPPSAAGIRRRSGAAFARVAAARSARSRAAPAEAGVSGISRGGDRRGAGRRGGAAAVVHRVRALATLRRSERGDALSGGSAKALASVFAKPAERRRADLRAGRFPESDGGGFCAI